MPAAWESAPIVGAAPDAGAGTAAGGQTPAWQSAPVVGHVSAEPAPPQGPSGPLANFAAGGNVAAANFFGAPVDAATWLLNQGIRGVNAATGAAIPAIEHPVGGSESIESAMGLIGADPRNVTAAGNLDRLARGAGEGAVSMALPYAGGRALIAGGTDGLLGAAGRMLGGPAPAETGLLRTGLGAAGNAAVGGAGGAVGAEAENLLPEDSPWRPAANFAGQLVGGGLTAGGMGLAKAGINYGAGLVGDIAGPMRQATREGLVADRLRAASSDPALLAQRLDVPNPELVPGSMPTTAQLSGDLGIGGLERTQQAKFPAPFLDRAAEQNAARGAVIGSLAPGDANAGAVRDLLQQQLARIDAAGEANVQAAQQGAQQAYAAAGGQQSRADYGALLRDQLEAAKARTKAAESQLWQAIDPQGNLMINATLVRDAANQILGDIPKTAKPPEGEEKAVFGFARLLGTAAPFQDFAALRSRLLGAIRDERVNGQTPALRRMQMLRSAMDNAISNTAEEASANNPNLSSWLAQQSGGFYGANTESAAAVSAGGNRGAIPPVNPGIGSQAAAGVPGAAGQAGRQFGSPAGYPSLSEPRRPQDLINFLLSRGGIQDEGGELAALDLDKVQKGYFGRLSRANGMPLDYAREAAIEAGYLHPDSDINDLLNALRRTQQGSPVFNESDPAAIAWREYNRAAQRGDLEGFPPLPGEPLAAVALMPQQPSATAPATWDAAAAARYRAAADATRNRAETFNNPIVGPALQERGGAYRLTDTQLPERFIGSPEGVQAFLAAGGDPGTLKDALVADLRRSGTSPDGSLDVGRYQTWLARRGEALRAFPDLQQTLGDAARAQNAVDVASAAARQQQLDYQRSAARYFLNAEPTQAVQSVLNGRNPVGDMAALSRLVAANPDAKAGLQRAVADYIGQRVIVGNGTAGGPLNATALNNLLKRNMALAKVFSPEQMQALSGLDADLQRMTRSLSGLRGSAAPSAAPDVATGGKLSLLSQYLGHGLAGLAGYLVGGVHGAIEGTGGYAMAKGALDAMKRAGIERTDQLLTEALLNPELAKTLLMTASPGNRPFIAQRLASQLGTLAVSAGAANARSSGQPQPPPVRPGAPVSTSNVVPLSARRPPVLVPGRAFAPAVGF